jgi:hypothetical protein
LLLRSCATGFLNHHRLYHIHRSTGGMENMTELEFKSLATEGYNRIP